ncbi:uncharacterized protein TNCV_2657981 [Trichonephila clavipes]|nr:uncharacterized protein TNCV_2657981 [Trichonephila clavipes]
MNLTWRNPPSHHWYAAKSPGLFIQCRSSRAHQMALARFRSGHLRNMTFVQGLNKYSKDWRSTHACRLEESGPSQMRFGGPDDPKINAAPSSPHKRGLYASVYKGGSFYCAIPLSRVQRRRGRIFLSIAHVWVGRPSEVAICLPAHLGEKWADSGLPSERMTRTFPRKGVPQLFSFSCT